ncbi:fimbrillin family protein, partial [Bacteroides thetaiotaomicron]|uniref:fimbrillin family protein n=1 Tax=Bacteroides thetaiotaomicron TaxID=818 RepID=UPI0034A2CAF0
MMKKGILFVLTAAFLASCQQEENEGVASVDRVTITPIITRATEVNFEDQDQIGLSVTKEDGTVYANNELMTFNDGAFAGSLKWYPEGADKSSFVAYYPYSATGVPTSFTVHADQTTNYGISDFMAASKSDVLPSVNSISMIFKHMLTKLVINVTNETNLDISSIVLKGSVPTANIDWATMKTTVSESAAATDITAQQVTKNTTFRAIVVPQTAAFTLAVTTSDNNTLMQKLVSTDLVQGGQYSVNIRVLPDNIIVTLSGEIENWTDEGEIKGDDSEVPFEEHDGYFIYDGITYNTVTLSNGTTWMAEPLRYVPDGYTPSSDPAADSHIWYPYELGTVDGT